jgi:hypothetical protein
LNTDTTFSFPWNIAVGIVIDCYLKGDDYWNLICCCSILQKVAYALGSIIYIKVFFCFSFIEPLTLTMTQYLFGDFRYRLGNKSNYGWVDLFCLIIALSRKSTNILQVQELKITYKSQIYVLLSFSFFSLIYQERVLIILGKLMWFFPFHEL